MRTAARFGQCLLVGLFLTLPCRAWAHEGDPSGGFIDGIAHPIFGLDHLLAMVAVGLWGAQLGVPAIWLLPVAFPLVMAIGGFLGLIGLAIPGIEIGVAASAVILGALVFLEAKPKLSVALVLVGLFAIFHGHAHGTELPAGASGVQYSVGFVIGTGLLHASGICLGLTDRFKWGDKAIRIAGGLIATGGCYYLLRAFS